MSRIEIDVDMLLKLLNERDLVGTSVTPEIKPAEVKPPVEKPRRCQNSGCKVKLMLSDFACKCKGYYCSQHRFSEAHNCSFDYRAASKDILTKQMPTVAGYKLERL